MAFPWPTQRLSRLVPTMLLVASAASAHAAVSGGVYTIDPHSIDGGGKPVSNGSYSDWATSIGHISQTTVTGGVYTLRSGYIAQLNPLGGSSGGPNTAPFCDPIADQTVLEDSGTTSVSVTGIGDADIPAQTLSVTATSSNLSLVLNPTVVYSAGAPTATLLFAPLPNAYGAATITVRIQDNGSPNLAFNRTFTVTVSPVNDAPTVATPADLVINEDSGLQTVSLTGINAGVANESGQVLTVTALSSDTSIIPTPSVSYTSPATTGSLSFTPVPNANGTVTILLRIADDGGLANGGTNVTYRSFTVTVTPVPDAPILAQNNGSTVIPAGSVQITNLALQVTDDGASSQITYSVTAVPTGGNLKRLATTLIVGSTFTQADIDSGLLSYANTSGVVGSDSFGFTAKDIDNQTFTNGGGATLPPQTFTLTISGSAATNNAPIAVLPGPTLTWTEGDAPLLVDATASVTDSPDNIAGGEMLCQLLNGGGFLNTAFDRLAVRNAGTGAGQIGVSGNVVTYGGTSIGQIDATDNGVGTNPLRIQLLAGTADQTAVQALLRAITYSNTNANPTPTPRRFQVTITDGDPTTPLVSNPVQKDINVVAVNSAPVVAWSKAGTTWTEGAPPVVLDNLATATDADSPGINTGTLTVSFAANGTLTDTLDLWNEGNGAGQVGISGVNVSYGGALVGTAAGGTSGTPLTISFNPAATPAIAQAVLEHVQYSNTSQNPSSTARVIQAVLNDGDPTSPQSSSPVSITVGVTGVNNAPVVTFGGSNPFTWTEGASASNPMLLDDDQSTGALDPSSTVVDPDSTDLAGGAMFVSFVSGATASDLLGIMPGGPAGSVISLAGSTISYDGGGGPVAIGTVSGNATSSSTMTVLFNASATPAAAQALLRRLYFDNTSSNPVELPSRVMQVVVLDGDGGTSVATGKTIIVNNINAAPTIAFPTGPLAYTENDPATLIDPAATLVDGDSANFAGGSMLVQLIGGTATASDVLSIRDIGIGAGQIGYTAGTGVITYGGTAIGTAAGGVWNPATSTVKLLIAFNGSATPAAGQALLRAIEYSNTSDNPSTTPRQVEASANDGQDAGSPVTMTVNVAAVNDAPTANAFPLGTIQDVPVMVDLQAEAQVTDPDSLAASVSFSIVTQPLIGGTVAVHPTRANTFVYTPSAGFVGATSFTYDATDGLATSPPATVNIYVTRRLGENRPLPLTDAPRLVYRLNTFRYDVAGDVSQLAGFPNLVFRLAGDAPNGVTIAPAIPASVTGAQVQWNVPTGVAPAHQQFGVIFTDTVSGTSGFIPLQYILLPDPATGG